MKVTNLILGILFFCFLAINTQAQELVKNVKVSPEKATLQMADQSPQSYLLEIGGPDDYYWKTQIDDVKEISLSTQQASGKTYVDGLYKLQVTPIFTLSPEQRAAITEIRATNDEKALAAFREKNGLPDQVNIYNINFSIRNGEFVNPDQKEAKLLIPGISSTWAQDHPALYASLNNIGVNYRKRTLASDGLTYASDNSLMSEDDQVILDDLIVVGSGCFGQDCVNGESFGFDTVRLKENNLRIKFQDTSTTASFPTNDWQITANDSSNGGANKFSIDDIDHGSTPFTIEASAPSHSLYVDDGGRIGLGTSTPVVEIHNRDGDSPTLRLEQDGSSGFTQQTWDVAGNEANFFVRDVTNGSTLPFKIRPGAPNDALVIGTNGNIGIGGGISGAPTPSVHVRRTNGTANVFIQEGSGTSSNRTLLTLENNGGNRIQFNNTDPADASEYTFGLNNSGILIMSRKGIAGTAFSVDDNNDIGVKTTSPDFDFEVEGTAGKTGGGIWATPSDRRLKTNIKDFTPGLEEVLKIHPVRYNFNGKMGLPTDKEYVGIIAQEMQRIAPYMITEKIHTDDEGVSGNYFSYDGSALTYMLINAVKTQNDKIEQQAKEITDLQEQLARLDQLQKEVAQLAELVKQSAANSSSGTSDK